MTLEPRKPAPSVSGMSIESIERLACELLVKSDFAGAEAVARKLRNIQPENATGLRIIGCLMGARGEQAKGAELLERACKARPDSADLHNEAARAAMDLRRWDLAELHLQAAVDIEPTMNRRLDLAMYYLVKGDWRRGWELYEARIPREIRTQKLVDYDVPRWEGGDKLGTLLVHGEAGYGDMMEFARFAIEAKARGLAECVIYRVPRGICRLLDKRAIGGIEIASQDDPLPQDADGWCFVMSLPRILGLATPDDIPLRDGILDVDSEKRRAFAARTSRPRVGFVWGGSPMMARDRLRSLPVQHLPDLFNDDRIEWHILQQGPHRQELKGDAQLGGHIVLHDDLHDFEETAELIETLDLVLTVCTSVAHLAGSMGVPTWVMLGSWPDFRWFYDRADSPWYSSAHVFRQDRPGGWAHIVANVRAALSERFALT